MASLKHLSNDDLRKKLREYGIKSPVTSSTRNILLKKLNHAMSSNKPEQTNRPNMSNTQSPRQNQKETLVENYTPVRVSPRSRSFLNSRSSELKNDKRSRLGLGNLNSFSSDEDEPGEELSQETQPSRLLRKNRKSLPVLDSSDSERPALSNASFGKKSPVIRKRAGYLPIQSPYIQLSSRSNNISEEFQYDTGSDSDFYDEGDGGKSINKIPVYSNEKLSSRKENAFANNISQRRYEKLSYNSSSKTPLNSRFKNEQNGLEYKKSFETSLGDRSGEITSPDDIVSQEPLNVNLQLANGQSPFDRVRKLTSEHCKSDSDFWLALPSVPILLVILLAVFFCFIGLCYLSINTSFAPTALISSLNVFQYKSKHVKLNNEEVVDDIISKDTYQTEEDTVSDSQNKFPVCETEEILANCLSTLELLNVQNILGLLENIVLPALSHQASVYQCKSSPHNYLTVNEMSNLIQDGLPQHKSDSDIVVGLKGLAKLASLNPHWGLTPVWGEMGNNRRELVGFESSSHSTEIICHITSAIYNLLFSVMALCVGCVAAWMVFKGFRYRKRKAEIAEQKSFELVEQILEVLENSCGTGGKDFIAVNHVRDCLIPPRERRDKMAIWNKAVGFIDDHDSRVYREIRSVGGEDQEVWRWVSGAPRSPISCPKSALPPDSNQLPEKIWQGQAFESLETTQNLPQVSPTSCLKIRNMFDCEIEYGDNWPCRIQDSLLEKCELIALTHIAVDRVSKEGCVYVKCASAAEAGKAYRALHGWWFDTNLVTVKYLREERYYERFPTARLATTSLTPSNNKRLSLQLYPTLPNSSLSSSPSISSSSLHKGSSSTARRKSSTRSPFGTS